MAKRCCMTVGGARCTNQVEDDLEICVDCEARLDQELNRVWQEKQLERSGRSMRS